ncbi:MAG: HlyD family secretion protein [Planctomycetes bacterium]|nr:HlyD family secretion protein [Planctomycetota bacterium]MCB9887718.1 HlyD family secretion protein [Planctomycetota bacterium]
MTESTTPRQDPAPEPRRRGRRLLAFAIVAAAVAGISFYFTSRLGTESTDDAFVDGNVFRVSFEVEGRVAHVHVADNATVEAGQLLVELDPAEYQARVDGAQAALELAQARLREARVQVTLTDASTTAALARARANLAAAQAHVEQQHADLESAQAEATRAEADLSRYRQLSERAVSKARLDLAAQSATVSDANLRAVQKRIASADADVIAAQADVTAAEADREQVAAARAATERFAAEVAQAKAALRHAELQLADTRVLAPAAGRVTRKAVLEGTYVEPGQTVLSIVAPDLWVVANFKETQLAAMRPGQKAHLHIDAFGFDLAGHVDSIQAGTGARFSLLPPENATGNYVKVVQRVPVKIVFDELPAAQALRLAAGMSVVPVVETR